MLNGKTVAVVVPAYNEEMQIGMVLDSMPEFVDRIVIVNDCSSDKTAHQVAEYMARHGNKSEVTLPLPEDIIPTIYNEADVVLEGLRKKEKDQLKPFEVINFSPDSERIILINHLENGGVGAAISTGYYWCREREIFCTAVMAGDGQMAPDELYNICLPIVNEGIDYVKGNRLSHLAAGNVIPRTRFFGNIILSLMTKVASGYWRISDAQTGYTSISLHALNNINISGIYPSYGVPNDILAKLNVSCCTIREVPIKPVYRVGEQSKMNVMKVIPRMIMLLIVMFCRRILKKYLLWHFHPLFIFYSLSLLSGLTSLGFLIYMICMMIIPGSIIATTIPILFWITLLFSFQFMGFAMWMDVQDNEHLQM